MSGDSSRDGTGGVIEVEFSIDNPAYPFVSATARADCVLELAEMVPRSEDRYAEFFNVTGVDPDRVLSLVETHETLDVTLLREHDDGGLFEFIAAGDCPAFTLAELGALPRDAVSLDGEGHIVAEVPAQVDAAAVVETFLAECPSAELVSKRAREDVTPMFTASTPEHVLGEHLTDRQQEVIRAAYDAGYYDWPRECTGQAMADRLGISSATFSEHIHAAERNLLAALLEPDAERPRRG